jgi:uncharacterized protein (TIGR02611 family)
MSTRMPQPAPKPPELVRKLRKRQETHKEHGIVYRGLFVVVGLTLLLGGIAMLLLPGPAFVVIPVGLGVLALEFAWADRLLEKALVKADAAKRKAANTGRATKVLSVAATGLALAAFVVAALLYDIPLLPV